MHTHVYSPAYTHTTMHTYTCPSIDPVGQGPASTTSCSCWPPYTQIPLNMPKPLLLGQSWKKNAENELFPFIWGQAEVPFIWGQVGSAGWWGQERSVCWCGLGHLGAYIGTLNGKGSKIKSFCPLVMRPEKLYFAAHRDKQPLRTITRLLQCAAISNVMLSVLLRFNKGF